MGLYDDLQAEAEGKPRSTVRIPNASKPIPQTAADRVKGFLEGVKDIGLPIALNAAQPLTAGYRDKIASWATGQPEEKVTEQVENYLGEKSNKVLNAAGHLAGGLVGDVGAGFMLKGGAKAAPQALGWADRPGFTGGGVSGGVIGGIGGVRDAWQDLISGDPERVKRGIGDTLVSTAGGMAGGAGAELVSPLLTWGGRVAKSRMTPMGKEELNDLNFRAAEARVKGYSPSLPEMMRLTGNPSLKHEVAPQLEGIMESGAKGQPGIRSSLPDKHTVARIDFDRPATGPQRAEWEARTTGPNNLYANAEEATREARRAQLAAERVHGDKPVYTKEPLPPSVEKLRGQVAKESREGMEGVPPRGTPERARSVVESAIARETDPRVAQQARDILADQNRRLADKAKADRNVIDMQRHLNAVEVNPAVDMSIPSMTVGLPGGNPLLRIGLDKIPGVQAANRRAAEMITTDPMRVAKRIGRGSAMTPFAAALAAQFGKGYSSLMFDD